MRKKLLYVFLIFMLIINAMLLYMIIDKKKRHDPPKGQTFLMKELNFSEDQKKQFLMLDDAHRKRMMQIDDESQLVRKKLFDTYEDESTSRESLMNRFGNLESARQEELFSFFSEVRKLCNDEQVKKFDKIIQRALHRKGPKPPDGPSGRP